MKQPTEAKTRVIMAWLSWWLMLAGTGVSIASLLIFIALFVVGGPGLIADVWAERDTDIPYFLVIVLGSYFLGGPTGAWFGVWLWAKLMYKTGFIKPERIRKMSGFNNTQSGQERS